MILVLTIARPFLPGIVRWYVIRTIDRSALYHAKIGDVQLHLWRGAYSIDDLRLIKVTGNVPFPLLKMKRLDLAIQWNALVHRRVVGQVVMEQPEINFVDAPDEAEAQTGAGGPWLQILRDLFPFKINRAEVIDGAIHLRTFQRKQPVDVFLGQLHATIENLTNIRDESNPLVSSVSAHGLAMDQAKFEFKMKFDPFSYEPSFNVAVRLLGLDVTKLNDLARTYGGFDFESGWLDLVVETEAKSGVITGYLKPLFRKMRIFNLPRDIKEDNPIEFVWKALLGTTTFVLKNQPRDQFGTLVPFHQDTNGTQPNMLATLGNLLRNAFIRAYLPKFQDGTTDTNGLQFDAPRLEDPTSAGDEL